MDEFMNALNAASLRISGEDLVDAAAGAESSMSASAAPPRVPRKVSASRNKQSNFSANEDNVLCKAWLEISCDPITNTGQRKESFWLRVVNRYNSKCGRYPQRSQKSIASRWDTIQAEVNKFSGYMAEKIRCNPSGMSDADKSVAAAADFAAIESHNFTLMHCWNILKDEPKWLELKKMDTPQNSVSSEQRNVLNLDLNSPSDDASPASSAGKRPMGRDAAKAAKRKAKLASSEHVSKMHELSVHKIDLFKETEAERKARLDEMVALEKVKVEEAREHRKQMLELEKERLAMEQKRLQMEVAQKEKEEDERIMAINLDQCQPTQHIYYQRLQDDILQKMMYRARGT
ncbi:unnamed protein product [Urochloa humidicola]